MRTYAISFVILPLFATACHAAVTTYTNKQQWQSAVGEYTTIDFTGFPNNTLITNQYTHLGVSFADGADFIHYSNSYTNDGVGLRGGIPESISIDFAAPIHWIAIDFPGSTWIELYSRGQLLYTSTELVGYFAGLVSTNSFDEVRIFEMAGGGTSIDDLHFGPPIPAPGALALLAIAAAIARRRRRNHVGLASA